MKKEQREAYLLLTQIKLPKPFDGFLGLCNLCKHAIFWGSDCDGTSDLECDFPVDTIYKNCHDVWGGGDCRAFRPKWPREDCVDLVGILLQGKWVDYNALRKAVLPQIVLWVIRAVGQRKNNSRLLGL